MGTKSEKTGHGEKRTRKQELLLSALLQSQNIELGAEMAGVSYNTARRWLAEPEFKARFQELRKQTVDIAVSRVSSVLTEVVEILVGIARDINAPVSSRVAACRELLERAVTAVQLGDIEARLTVLEERRNHGFRG